eukprot:g7940.t1
MIRGVIKRRRLDRPARRDNWLPSVVWQVIADYLYRRDDVAALRQLCGAEPQLVRSWALKDPPPQHLPPKGYELASQFNALRPLGWNSV